MTRGNLRLASATFGLTWLVLVATSPGIPMVWDEGEYLGRAQHIIEWFRIRPLDFSAETIKRYWLFIFYSEGHPAGFAIPIALGKWIASPWLDPLTAARLGPITLFSTACATVAVRLKKDYGTTAAIAAPALLLTFPRIFSEAHFATQDGQLAAWWLILWALQSELSPGPGVSAGLGAVLGLLTATKFTGWIAWTPTVLSEAIKGRPGWLRLRIIIPVALVVFGMVNPPLWHQPIAGAVEYFRRNLDRSNTLNISMMFLGGLYNLERPLPWYNTLAWMVFVTPVATLALGIIGLWRCLAGRTHSSISLLLHWIPLMVIRALPLAGTPPHDGIRLILPPFAFWCVIAAIGAQWIFDRASTGDQVWRRMSLRAALASVLVLNTAGIFRYYPQTLSHYSSLVGGVRGAADKGMEPAYWWDALDKDVLAWLNENTSPGESIAFSTISHIGFLRETGRLRAEAVEPEKSPFKWYVLQNRPGIFSPTDRFLMRDEQPVYAKYAGRRSMQEKVPDDLNVPLIAVFSYEQYRRIRHR